MSDDELYERIAQILERARNQVARSVNTAMVQAYWQVGREIVEIEQAGEQRAGYGEEVIERLSTRLKKVFGKGFGVRNLHSMRQFYLNFPTGSMLPEIRQAVPAESGQPIQQALPAKSGERAIRQALAGRSSRGKLRQAPPARSRGSVIRSALPREFAGAQFPSALGWTHYVTLMRVTNPTARAFYEIEAARECWSTRQLERQIGALLFDRLAKHRDPEAVLALARQGQEVSRPNDVIKDPSCSSSSISPSIQRCMSGTSSRRSSIASRASCSSWARASASSDGRNG